MSYEVTNETSHIVKYLLAAIRHQTVQRDRNLRDLVSTPRSRKLRRTRWYAHQHAIGLLIAAVERVTEPVAVRVAA